MVVGLVWNSGTVRLDEWFKRWVFYFRNSWRFEAKMVVVQMVELARILWKARNAILFRNLKVKDVSSFVMEQPRLKCRDSLGKNLDQGSKGERETSFFWRDDEPRDLSIIVEDAAWDKTTQLGVVAWVVERNGKAILEEGFILIGDLATQLEARVWLEAIKWAHDKGWREVDVIIDSELLVLWSRGERRPTKECILVLQEVNLMA